MLESVNFLLHLGRPVASYFRAGRCQFLPSPVHPHCHFVLTPMVFALMSALPWVFLVLPYTLIEKPPPPPKKPSPRDVLSCGGCYFFVQNPFCFTVRVDDPPRPHGLGGSSEKPGCKRVCGSSLSQPDWLAEDSFLGCSMIEAH